MMSAGDLIVKLSHVQTKGPYVLKLGSLQVIFFFKVQMISKTKFKPMQVIKNIYISSSLKLRLDSKTTY